ncbi:FAD-dependent monooxygenase [Streptomyces sp. NBC_00354]
MVSIGECSSSSGRSGPGSASSTRPWSRSPRARCPRSCRGWRTARSSPPATRCSTSAGPASGPPRCPGGARTCTIRCPTGVSASSTGSRSCVCTETGRTPWRRRTVRAGAWPPCRIRCRPTPPTTSSVSCTGCAESTTRRNGPTATPAGSATPAGRDWPCPCRRPGRRAPPSARSERARGRRPLRRTVLDEILVEAAEASGAEVRQGFTVEDLVIEGDTVTGIRGHGAAGSGATEYARVVIGADGIHSLVAKAVGAAAYAEKPKLQCSPGAGAVVRGAGTVSGPGGTARGHGGAEPLPQAVRTRLGARR